MAELLENTMPFKTEQKRFDPILDSPSDLDSDRFVMMPTPDNLEMWEHFKTQQAKLWVMEEVDLGIDKKNFTKLGDPVQFFIKVVLAFFAAADGIVNENIIRNMQMQCKQKSVQAFYTIQSYIETVHQETYTQLIFNLIGSEQEQQRLFRAIDTNAFIRVKTDWVKNWMEREDASFDQLLVAFSCCEGILFSSSFASIFYLKTKGYELPGLYQSNELISVDEGIHQTAACTLHRQLQKWNKIPDSEVLEIVRSAVEVEKEFVRGSLQLPLIGMHMENMIQYVEYVGDVHLNLLGLPKFYKSTNPFPFMDFISMEGKANFFEKKVTGYNVANVGSTAEERTFALDVEF